MVALSMDISSKSNNETVDFVIRPPTTTNDDGRPGDSLLQDTKRIFAFIEDERHLAAYKLYESVIQRLEKVAKKSPPRPSRFRRSKSREEVEFEGTQHDAQGARTLLESRKADIEKLKVSYW
jgi:hypothetical protein